jgi:hypothetical protein
LKFSVTNQSNFSVANHCSHFKRYWWRYVAESCDRDAGQCGGSSALPFSVL